MAKRRLNIDAELVWHLWWCYRRTIDPRYALRAFQALRKARPLTEKEQDFALAIALQPPRKASKGPAKRELERDYDILRKVVVLSRLEPERDITDIFACVARRYSIYRRRTKDWTPMRASTVAKIWYEEQKRLERDRDLPNWPGWVNRNSPLYRLAPSAPTPNQE